MFKPEEQRRFAIDVVRRLHEAGFEAYWAGGCVRDQLLKRRPKDYDVATNAEPEQVRRLFGRRRTLAIGAAFGVIAVVGPRAAGTVEVTTFRRDASYSDGRHPDSVVFSSAEEDASRRDFTINALFYDPLQERVIDFVGGQKDLADKRIRAVGNPRLRFAEDKLRMLRAVRFAAELDFKLDDDVRLAIAEMARDIHIVSPERIAMELRRLLINSRRAAGVSLLVDTGLGAELLPEIIPGDLAQRQRLDATLAVLGRFGKQCSFTLALAALLVPYIDASGAAAVCHRWKLSNRETQQVRWLVRNHAALVNACEMPWSKLQPLLVAEGIDELVRLTDAARLADDKNIGYCRALLAKPREELDPPPLLTGDDLLAAGIPPGPKFKTLLQRVRDAQLDGLIGDKTAALAMARALFIPKEQ